MTRGEISGNALRNIMCSISNIENLSKTLNDIGVSVYDANEEVKSICTLLEELKDKFIDIKR